MTTVLLEGRELLPKQGNNRPLRWSNTRAEDIAKQMKAGTSNPFERLLEVADGLLTDRVPYPLVIAAFRQLCTEVEVLAVQGVQRLNERPVEALVALETRAEGAANLTQLFVSAHPDSLEAVESAARATDQHIRAAIECRDGLERRAAMLRQASTCGMRVMS